MTTEPLCQYPRPKPPLQPLTTKVVETLAQSLARRIAALGYTIDSVMDGEVIVSGGIHLRLPGHGVSLFHEDSGYQSFKNTDDCVAMFRKAARSVG